MSAFWVLIETTSLYLFRKTFEEGTSAYTEPQLIAQGITALTVSGSHKKQRVEAGLELLDE
jgi:hypothetical protein